MTSRRVRWDIGLPVSWQVGLQCIRRNPLASYGPVRAFKLIDFGAPAFGLRAGGRVCLACADWKPARRRVLATQPPARAKSSPLRLETRHVPLEGTVPRQRSTGIDLPDRG